jgi:hypothetical protein
MSNTIDKALGIVEEISTDNKKQEVMPLSQEDWGDANMWREIMNTSDKTFTIWSKEERMQWKEYWNSPKNRTIHGPTKLPETLLNRLQRLLKNLVTYKRK